MSTDRGRRYWMILAFERQKEAKSWEKSLVLPELTVDLPDAQAPTGVVP
jgi:hypothetical protein